MARRGAPDRQLDSAARAGRAAGRPPAAAAGRRRAGRGDRRSGRAWPPAGRHRRDLLAIPPLSAGRLAEPHRLAPVGPHQPAVPARPGVGGGRERLAVARPLGLDGLPLGRGLADQGRPGAAPAAGAGLAVDPGGRADRAARQRRRRPAAGSAWPLRGPARRAGCRPACRRSSPCRATPASSCQRLLHPARRAARAAAGF